LRRNSGRRGKEAGLAVVASFSLALEDAGAVEWVATSSSVATVLWGIVAWGKVLKEGDWGWPESEAATLV
jgi:hypothetical protein